MGRIFLLLMCLSTAWINGQEIVPARVVEEHLTFSKFEETSIFKTAQRSEVDLPKEVTEYNILSLDRQALKNLINKSDENISFTIPVNDRETMVLQLVETRMEGLIIRESNGNRQVKFNPGRHYQGIIKGNPNSLVALSFFENDVMGFISDDRSSGNLVIGKMEDNSGDFIIYRDDELLSKIPLECGTDDGGMAYDPAEILHGPADRALSDCVKLYFEVDYNIFTNKGGMTPTINYITGLYNQVKVLYNNESINTTVSEIFVWSTPSPYNGTNSSTMLNQFTAYRNGFNGNIAMLLSFSASGGIAYVNTLCNSNPDYRMSFSSINTTYGTVPTYSWSVEVVTHEFGHLLGSQHTHACAWNGNNTAIDGCYTPEGGCANPGLPSGGGTIMSYCHLTSVGINFNNGFGPQPGNLIRNKVTVASCLTACPGAPTPTCTDGIQNGQETGVDCGGPTCPPCSTGCTTNSGTLTLVLDNYPSETTWNIKNANNVILYSGGPYSIAGATITVPLCLPNACYTFNIFDSYGDGICCTYGNGSYNVVINGTNVASGGQFASAQTRSFCLNATAPSCTDGIKNGQETGVDCGGPTCPPCPPSCTDGIQNGQETGIDCGGPTCPPCPPSCTDGIQNGQETGIDCGGPSCPPCAATCTDGIQNGQETGVDCGGPTCPPCPPTCTDGIQNGQETGVDCGGPTCPPCGSTGSTTLGAYYFETGWDSWIDGGDDAIRYSGTRSYEGSYSISLRDNSGVISSMTSPAYQASTYASLQVEFNFYAYSMDPNEDFWLQYSNNNGSTWTTVGAWVSGTNFVNNTFYLATVTINNANYGFTNSSKFRFVCDASTNSDLIYIDAVKVKGLSTSNLEGNQLLAMSSGIETKEKEITVFPIPASDELTIQVREAGDSDMQVSLMDIMGKNYTTTILTAGQSIVKVDLGEIRQGIYILTVSNDGEIVHSERVVVIHP
ncbi:MAG: T9SS type A sorting domain-containing protein [Saprospiraceae bacterium]|nr:T9SS type A sorting domain-containing protein [Saprospiraceae bacterium]